jgi:hypothetical protein
MVQSSLNFTPEGTGSARRERQIRDPSHEFRPPNLQSPALIDAIDIDTLSCSQLHALWWCGICVHRHTRSPILPRLMILGPEPYLLAVPAVEATVILRTFAAATNQDGVPIGEQRNLSHALGMIPSPLRPFGKKFRRDALTLRSAKPRPGSLSPIRRFLPDNALCAPSHPRNI